MGLKTIDTTIHQWTMDPSKMEELVPEKWADRVASKDSGGLVMPTVPWYHAFWNEDTANTAHPNAEQYSDSDRYRSPEKVDRYLADQDVEYAILAGHEIRFLPSLLDTEYQVAIASAYNELLSERWLSYSDRLKGGIIVPMDDPEAGVAEIDRHADDSEFVTVMMYGGTELPLGHRFYRPVFEAAERAGLPITIHTSGNPVNRQTAAGAPIEYAAHDINLGQNHITNAISLIFQGVLDRYPELDIVWAGQGTEWMLQTMWRSTRYYRNLEDQSPDLDREPWEYMKENFYYTSFPLGEHDDAKLEILWEMVGEENILYASGYPDWNCDAPESLPELPEATSEKIRRENAQRLYDL